MTSPAIPVPAAAPAEALRSALAQGSRLAAAGDAALFHAVAARQVPEFVSDGVVMQVRAMLASLADQIVDRDTVSDAEHEALIDSLAADGALVEHCHELALEWRLALRLEAGLGLDPVLSPLFRDGAGREQVQPAALTIATLSAQARFAQHRRRMELPLGELPGEIFARAIAVIGGKAASPGALERLERLRAGYDEGETRLALLGRLAHQSADAEDASDVEYAGVALWLSVVAMHSGQPRKAVVAATALPGCERLLVVAQASGMAHEIAVSLARALGQDIAKAGDFAALGRSDAARLLAEVSQA